MHWADLLLRFGSVSFRERADLAGTTFFRRLKMWEKYLKIRRAILPYLVIATCVYALGTVEYLLNWR